MQAGQALVHLAAQPRQLGGLSRSVAAGRQPGSVDQDHDATSDPTHGHAHHEKTCQSAHHENAEHCQERIHAARLRSRSPESVPDKPARLVRLRYSTRRSNGSITLP